MAQFEIDFLDDYSDESLLSEIRRIAALHGGSSLSTEKFKELSNRVSISAIRRRFGGWQAALEQAGLGHLYCGGAISAKMRSQPAKRLSDDDLIAEMQRVHKLVGKGFLTVADFNVQSTTSAGTVRNRFGSWANALKLAGIPQSESANKNWTDDECFENLAGVWTHYGRPPTFREMFEPPSRISGGAYETRWKTWRKALRVFVEWTQTESSAEAQGNLVVPQPRARRALPARPEEDRRHVSPRLRFVVFKRDRFRCVTCGRSPATHLDVELQADHIVPVAAGGKTVMENLRALCQDCNLGKGAMPA